MSLYKLLGKPLLFLFDPETSHRFAIVSSSLLRFPGLKQAADAVCRVQNPSLESELFGCKFSNPVGIAAGVDKDCEVLDVFKTFGFGWVEAGTVTPKPQIGNPKPRMHRFSQHNALVNSMGFPSKGIQGAAKNLAAIKTKELPVVGLSIGKNKESEGEKAFADYREVAAGLYEYADFFVVNVSSPNTPGLREFQEANKLAPIISAINEINKSNKSILVKFAPDLTQEQLENGLSTCLDCGVDGVVATNTTISRTDVPEAKELPGGLSGTPLKKRSLEMVSHIYSFTKGRLPIIGIGGISTAEDAINMIKAGASLIAMYTGLVYEGPGIAKKINKGLIDYLNKHNMSSVSQLVGADHQLSEGERATA